MVVDSDTSDTLSLTMDITFHSLPCSHCIFDFMSVSGEHALNVVDGLQRIPLQTNKNIPLSNDIGGCRVVGSIKIRKVAGNIHLAAGGSSYSSSTNRHIHSYKIDELQTFNTSHIIHTLSFGPNIPTVPSYKPLDMYTNSVKDGLGNFQYFIKIIPTTYKSFTKNINTYQYSVTERTIPIDTQTLHLNGPILPGIFFIYDFSPFRVLIVSQRKYFTSFLVSLCAIIGGTMFLVGIIDSIIFYTSNTFMRNRHMYSRV